MYIVYITLFVCRCSKTRLAANPPQKIKSPDRKNEKRICFLGHTAHVSARKQKMWSKDLLFSSHHPHRYLSIFNLPQIRLSLRLCYALQWRTVQQWDSKGEQGSPKALWDRSDSTRNADKLILTPLPTWNRGVGPGTGQPWGWQQLQKLPRTALMCTAQLSTSTPLPAQPPPALSFKKAVRRSSSCTRTEIITL